MGKIFTRPISAEQKEKIAARAKPSQDAILKAQDELFLNLLLRVNELERKKDGD